MLEVTERLEINGKPGNLGEIYHIEVRKVIPDPVIRQGLAFSSLEKKLGTKAPDSNRPGTEAIFVKLCIARESESEYPGLN